MLPVPSIKGAPPRLKVFEEVIGPFLPGLARMYLRMGGRNFELGNDIHGAAAALEEALIGLALERLEAASRNWMEVSAGVLYTPKPVLAVSVEVHYYSYLAVDFLDRLRKRRGVYRLVREMLLIISTRRLPVTALEDLAMWGMYDEQLSYLEQEGDEEALKSIRGEMRNFLRHISAPAASRLPKDIDRWISSARRRRLPRLRLKPEERKWIEKGILMLELFNGEAPFLAADKYPSSDMDRLSLPEFFYVVWNPDDYLASTHFDYLNNYAGDQGPPVVRFEVRGSGDFEKIRRKIEAIGLLGEFLIEGEKPWK